jgi:hypothetical protein
MAFDVNLQRVLLFGGGNPLIAQYYYGDTWSWDGAAWVQVANTGPTARYGHVMVCDTGRGRVVLFGGTDDTADRSDTWEWDGASWTQRAATGPGARNQMAMAYDAARARTVLIDGNSSNAAYPHKPLWEWDGNQWTEPAVALPTAPSRRTSASMVFNSGRGRIVLWGGRYYSSSLNETWEWDGNGWLLASTLGPAGAGASTYDSGRGRTIAYTGTTWEWDGQAWEERATDGPSQRQGAAMAYDPERARTVLFGGFGSAMCSDTWEWDGTSWAQVATSGPPARYLHAMAYHPGRHRVMLFGGSAGSYFGDLWEWDGQTWTQLPGEGPIPRSSCSMAFDESRGAMVVSCGITYFPTLASNGWYQGDLWEWNGSWTERSRTGGSEPDGHFDSDGGPLGRSGPAVAYDSARHRLMLFGGNDFNDSRDDFWAWGMPAPTVLRQPASVNACVGATVGMSIAVGGLDAACQWRKGGVPIPGATSTTLRFSPVSAADAGDYDCVVGNGCASVTSQTAHLAVCYANCDCSAVSPVLNVNDFQCFVNKFAAGDAYANCDGSTAPPILNVNDFQCFVNAFAAGCGL